jgi:SAM-dependent methyltransferase
VVDRVLESPYVRELLIVDDGSSDGTVDIVRSIRDPRVRVFIQPINLGKGAALRRGFREATAPYVIVQDADLEYDPGEYAQILSPLLEGVADVVYGSRFLGGRPHRVLYYWHSVGNGLLTTLSNMFTNLNLTDMETCYKAFRREVIQDVDLHEDRFGFEPEITAKLSRKGLRIYEVGISYAGRTYAEGKKIGWRDGVRAFYGIVRYSGIGERVGRRPQHLSDDEPAPFAEADLALADVLDSLQDADNYADWIAELLEPHLGRRVLEVGAGQGELTERLRRGDRHVTATDLSTRCVTALSERFAGDPSVTVQQADLVPDGYDGEFDSVVLVNVLEHIPYDEEALTRLVPKLRPGGRLVLFVPAFESLYSEFDFRIGHRRRYRRSELASEVDRVGLRVVEARYVNALGALAWWLFARQMKQVPTQPWSSRLFDRVGVRVTRRFESTRSVRFGQSLLCIAERD